MISRFGIIIVVVVVVHVAILHPCIGDIQPMEVQIFYETLCPACQQFFTEQFQPDFEKFGDYVRWILIPYKYAQTTRDSTTGEPLGIVCHHGELECRGQAIQACALQNIPDYLTQLRFCACFMVNRGDCGAFQRCSQALGVDYNMLNTCTSIDGLRYLSYYADLYNRIIPRTTNIVINGRPVTVEEKSLFYSNMKKVICDNMVDPKPQICSTVVHAPVPLAPICVL